MRDYIKVKSVRINQVDDYISKGWEIIETTKEWTGHSAEDMALNYHIGLSSRTLLEKYEAIVKDYEKFGYKEKLFRSVAESNGKDIENYEQSGWSVAKDETSKYMTNYELVTDGDKTEYGVKRSEKKDILF